MTENKFQVHADRLDGVLYRRQWGSWHDGTVGAVAVTKEINGFVVWKGVATKPSRYAQHEAQLFFEFSCIEETRERALETAVEMLPKKEVL